MKKYWFILGNFPLLSTAEILAVLSLDKEIYTLKDNLLLIENKEFEAKQLIKQIGGTIKIGEHISSNLSEAELLIKITKILEELPGKINFGISIYGKEDRYFIKNLAIKIKQSLKDVNRNARFIFKNEPTLSSVTVEKNKLTSKGIEFLITSDKKTFDLGYTLAVQPFEDFGKRDYGRPGRDNKSGMLPPKLALMMLNITGAKKDNLIYDPFCGSGTIITEALLQGYKNILGSDISEKAVMDTEKNINWLKDKEGKEININIFQSDAQDISKNIKSEEVDTICAEPFLGKPLRGNEPESFLKKQAQELKDLYISSFAEFKKILKKNGTVVFIIPKFKTNNGWISVECEKDLEKMGFKPERLLRQNDQKNNFLLYYRAGQKVGREIWKFKFING